MSLLAKISLLGLAMVLAGGAAAATPPSADPRDLEGVWFKPAPEALAPVRDKYGDTLEEEPPPMTKAALALYNRREEARKAGHPLVDPMVKCAPTGVPRAISRPYPFQIVQVPGLIAIVHEGSHTNWLIRMDAAHPAHVKPSWMGDSVGHWEGDTLVVDTVGQRADNLTPANSPISTATHVVERIRKIAGGAKLEDVYTIDDPKLYTKPWTRRLEFLWSPDETVMEYICEESGRLEDAAAAAYH
jgi:hypothetical protein